MMLSRVGRASISRSLVSKSKNSVLVRGSKTFSKKRAISKGQLSGDTDVSKDGVEGTVAGTKAPIPPPAARSSSDGSPYLITGAGFAVASSIAAYMYYEVVPDEAVTDKDIEEEEEVAEEKVEVAEEKVEEVKPEAVEKPAGVTLEAMHDLGVKGRYSSDVAILPLPEHDISGNRVSSIISKAEDKEDRNLLLEAASELQSTTLKQSHESIQKALSLLRADVDQSYLVDLDSLSPSDLKIRLIQLSSELTDRARYEALRTKEVLALHDKEISQKYLELLQKQRLEFEDLLAQRIRQQEDELSRKTNALLQQKDDSIQTLLQANTKALEHEHAAQLSSTIQQQQSQLEQKYQIQYEEQLSNAKHNFQNQLNALTESMEELQARCTALQDKVKLNQTFQLDSVKAHSICAAALTLMNKLSEDKTVNVQVEVQALQALVDQDSVLASALAALPKSVLTKGVPSLSELKVRFDHVHHSARQAAMVPEGKYDLFSQLFGIIFAKLTIPPSPSFNFEDNDSSKLSIDYALSNAYHYIQLGQLEQALEQLNNIQSTNQASFTIKDWKQDAQDRVAVEKVRKIIQLECAILNATMSNSSD